MEHNSEVVITLTPSDNSLKRTFTLNPAKRSILIGRSSKTPSRGLVAASDNAWFDSPIMSRTHAKITAVFEPARSLLLQDLKSTHGTFIEERQLEDNVDYFVNAQNNITFGQNVTSGSTTFPAQEFRVDYFWQFWSNPTPDTSPENLNKTFRVPDADSESGEDQPREGSFSRTDPRNRAVSIGSSEGLSGSDVDDLMVLFSPPHHEHLGTTQNPSDLSSANRSAKEGAQTAKVDKPFILYSPVTSGVEVFDLTEDEGVDDVNKAGSGTSHANPINLERPTTTASYSIVSDSEDEGPEALPIKSVSQKNVESIPQVQTQLPAEPKTSRASEDSNPHESITSIADSDLGETDSEVNFSSDEELNSVTEAPNKAQESGSVWRPTATPWYSDDEEEEDDVDDDFDLDVGPKKDPKSDVVPQIAPVADKGTKPRVHFEIRDEPAAPHHRMFVEDSQPSPNVPTRTSFSDSIDVSHENLNPWVRPTPRAPSPSDAAMVKAAMAKMPTEVLGNVVEGGAFSSLHKKNIEHTHLPSHASSTSSRWMDYVSINNTAGFGDYRTHQPDFDLSVDRGFSRYDDGPFSGWQKYDPMSGMPAAPSQHFNPPNRPLGLSHRYEHSYPVVGTFQSEPQYCGYNGEVRDEFSQVRSSPSILFGGKGKLPEPDMAQGTSESKSSKLPISDIVNGSPSLSGAPARSLKRKADDITMDESVEPGVAQISRTQAVSVLCPGSGLPDAQPREELSVSETFSEEALVHSVPPAQRVETSSAPCENKADPDQISQTQLKSFEECSSQAKLVNARTYAQSMAHQHRKSMPQPVPAETEGPARKRVKTSSKGSGRVGAFVSGLVVGGLSLAGAFAAFIATIPETVKDEVRREFQNRV